MLLFFIGFLTAKALSSGNSIEAKAQDRPSRREARQERASDRAFEQEWREHKEAEAARQLRPENRNSLWLSAIFLLITIPLYIHMPELNERDRTCGRTFASLCEIRNFIANIVIFFGLPIIFTQLIFLASKIMSRQGKNGWRFWVNVVTGVIALMPALAMNISRILL